LVSSIVGISMLSRGSESRRGWLDIVEGMKQGAKAEAYAKLSRRRAETLIVLHAGDRAIIPSHVESE
jgi:hypothetical protein